MVSEDDYYYFQTYGTAHRPPREAMIQYGQAVLIVLGADGEISPAEMACFLGIASASGTPEDVRAIWMSYDWRHGRLEDCMRGIATDPSHPGEVSLAFLYDAIRISRVDGYADNERSAVARAAKSVGVSAEHVGALENLVETEEALRRLKVSLLNPGTTRGRVPSTTG